MSELSAELQWRGLVHQMTDPELPKLLDHDSLTFYAGFDPTADSLHVGSLLQLCTMRRVQEAGHRPIALVGGGTGLIGDPSGKEDERALPDAERLEANREAIRGQLERFIDFTDGHGLLLDNAGWLRAYPLTDFLRDVGKHFSVNEMIRKESVRSRLEGREHGISFTEFSYMLLQAYDFLHLFDHHGCRLQLGGSDQWGNITEGVDLIRRLRGGQAYGLTSPLILKADGTKFGKTETGTVWLDPARTSPYRFFQYWVRTDDHEVGMLLRFFTWLPPERVQELDDETAARPDRREAHRVLARSVTALVHGEAQAAAAERAAQVLFTEDIAGLDEPTLLEVFADAPSSTRPRADLEGEGLPLVDALVGAGLAPSKSAARTLVRQKGASVNNRVEEDEARRLGAEDLLCGGYLVLRKGRRDHHLVRFR
ncbi:MAG TPA: tyrosine--tRNA ligase [Acidimicrobiales bacterium]|nr:tyrosine--tRNA ligase [Acidimicrobiales bacterium]